MILERGDDEIEKARLPDEADDVVKDIKRQTRRHLVSTHVFLSQFDLTSV
jgi:hypothetical protein